MKKMTTFLGGALIAAALLLSGCQNFLTANAEAREKLRAEADYNRASSIKVSAHVENNSHGVIAKTVTDAKVGYPFQIGFNCADDYYLKGWTVKDGSRSLSNESDYAVQEMGNGTYEITVKSSVSSIELIPECYKQPTVTFMNPKEYSDDGLDSSVRGESLNILGSQMVKVGETYLLNLKTDKGYKIDAIKIKKDGRDLTDFEGIVSFSGKKVIDGIYQEKIKFLSHEADGIEICPTVAVGNYDAGNMVLGAPVILINTEKMTAYSTYPNSFKSFDASVENNYKEMKKYASEGSMKMLDLYFKQTEGIPYTNLYVEERVMKIPSDSMVKDKSGKWIRGEKVGQCYSKTFDFLKGDILAESEYFWSGKVEKKQDYKGDFVSLDLNLLKPGWHQWNVWAISKDKDGSEIKSDIPLVVVIKISGFDKPYYDCDGINLDQNYYYGTIAISKSDRTNEHSTSDMLFICISAGGKEKIHGIEFKVEGSSTVQGVDYTLLKYCTFGSKDGYTTWAAFGGKDPLIWRVSTPFRGTENKIECFWIDWLGNKGPSTVFTYNAPKAFAGEIALAKASSKTGGYSTDYVTYMSKTDYKTWGEKSLVDNNKMAKIGYVYYSDEKNVLVLNPNVETTECAFQSTGNYLEESLINRCYKLNGYSIERDYNRIMGVHEDYWRLKDASGNVNYPAISRAYNDTKTTLKIPTPAGNNFWDEKIIDIGWYIPTVQILYNQLINSSLTKVNEWSDSPLKSVNCYWTLTPDTYTGSNYTPSIIVFESNGNGTSFSVKRATYANDKKYKVNSNNYTIKVLTITNLGDKRYQEVTKD